MNIPLRVISQEHKANSKKSIVTSGPSIINDEDSGKSTNEKNSSTKKTRPAGPENTKKSVLASGPSIINNPIVKETTNYNAAKTQSTISRPDFEPQKKQTIPAAPQLSNNYLQYQSYSQPQNQYFMGYDQAPQFPYMQNYWQMNRLGTQNMGFTRSFNYNGFENYQYLTSPGNPNNGIKKELAYEFHQKKDANKVAKEDTESKTKPMKDVSGTKKEIIESNDVMDSLAYPTKGSLAQQTDSKAVFESDPFENTKRSQITRVQQRLMLLRRKRKSVDENKKSSVKNKSSTENEKLLVDEKRRKISVVSQSSVLVTKGVVKRKTQNTSTAARKRNNEFGQKKLTNGKPSLKDAANQRAKKASKNFSGKSNIDIRKSIKQNSIRQKATSKDQVSNNNILYKKHGAPDGTTSLRNQVQAKKKSFEARPVAAKRRYSPTISPTKRSRVPQPKPSTTIQQKSKILTSDDNNAKAWSLNSTFLDALNKGVVISTGKRFSVNKALKGVGKNTRKSLITRRHKQPKLKHKEKKRKTIEKEHESLTKGIMQNALSASFIQPTQAASQTVMMSSVDRLLGNNTILSEPHLDANSSLVDHETLASSPLKEETGSSRSSIAAIGESAFNSALDQPKMLSFSDEAMGEKTRGTDFGVNDVEESLMKSMEVKDDSDGGDKRKRKKSEIVALHYGDNIRDKKSEIADVFKQALEKEGDVVQNILEIKNVKKSAISRPLHITKVKNNRKSIISEPIHTMEIKGIKKSDISQNTGNEIIMDPKKLNLPKSVKTSINSADIKKAIVQSKVKDVVVKTPKAQNLVTSKKYHIASPNIERIPETKAKKSIAPSPDNAMKVSFKKSSTPRVKESIESNKEMKSNIKKTLKLKNDAIQSGTQSKDIRELKTVHESSKFTEEKDLKRTLSKKTVKVKAKRQEMSSNENIMEIQ